MEFELRPERPGEEAAIHELTAAAFAPMTFSDGSEPSIVDSLREAGDLSLSLVAVGPTGEIVGHVAFSRVTLSGSGGTWFGLGPISVLPFRQRRGIGCALVRKGLETLDGDGATGGVLIGSPDYYERFGFRSNDGLRYGDVPARFVQGLSFRGPVPTGEIRYGAAFPV